MARTKLSLEDSIFFYFSSAPLADAQEQYKKIRGILAHRSRGLGKRKPQTRRSHLPAHEQELITT